MNSPTTFRLVSRTILLFWISLQTVFAQLPERPNPPRLVNDLVGVLTKSEQSALEQKLVAYNDSTSTQIAILIVPDLGDYDIMDFGTRVFEKWEIGTKGKDNGVLITVAINNRKMSINTGYGVESILTDALARRIIENDLKPNFRANNYYGGLNSAVNKLFSLFSGNFTGNDKETESDVPNILIFILFFIIWVIVMAKRNNHGGGSTFHPSRGRSYRGPVFLPPMGGFGRGGGGGGFGGFGGGMTGGGGASGGW